MKKKNDNMNTFFKRDKAEYRKYSKERRKLRKQLIKAAKDYKDYDYGYIFKVLEVMLQMQYNLHSRPKVVIYDTKSIYNDYDAIVDSLNKSLELIKEVQGPEMLKTRPEQEILDDLFTTISKNITSWWE